MCYSVNTSILSLVLALGSVLYAINTNQIILGIFILFYCQIQLSEAIIWHGIDTKSLTLNKIGTTYGKYLLPTHIFAVGLGILIVALQNKTLEELEYFDILPIIIGIIFYFIIIFTQYNYDKDISMPIDSSCKNCQKFANRLVWGFNTSWYKYSFYISLLLGLLYIKSLKSKVFILLIYIITFIISTILFPKVNASSFWCFSAALIAPIVVYINQKLV